LMGRVSPRLGRDADQVDRLDDRHRHSYLP
jgi:hypothetical protein